MTEFEILRGHVGHDIKCVMYGALNATVECHTCNEVIYSVDKDDSYVEED